TSYLHISTVDDPNLYEGASVTRGTQIGVVAHIDTGDHLHFSIRRSAYDPLAWRGALPQIEERHCHCNDGEFNDPLFPEYFVDPSTASYTDGAGQCGGGTSESFRIGGMAPVHPDGTLEKTSDSPTVFLLQNGMRHGIASPAVLHSLYPNGGFDFKD